MMDMKLHSLQFIVESVIPADFRQKHCLNMCSNIYMETSYFCDFLADKAVEDSQ